MAGNYRNINPQQLRTGMGNEDRMRNELFARQAGEYEDQGAQAGVNEEPTIDQLVRQADNTHQDTTAAARRALRVVKETTQVQEQTMLELEKQGKQMNRTNQMLNQVNSDLTYSEKLLRYMRRCCCCWMCDSCTGADPEDQIKRKWEKQVDKGKTSGADISSDVVRGKDDRNSAGSQYATGQRTSAGPSNNLNGGPRYRDPDIRLTEEHKGKELQMNAETRKQNEILDEIHSGLGQLLNNARVIGEELGEQNKAAEQLQDRMENTQGRIHNVNTKSQLREFRVKKK